VVVIYGKLALAALIWGATFIAAKFILPTMPVFSAAFLRFAIATGCLMLFLRQLPRPKPFWPLVILGLSGVFAYNFFFFVGLQTVPASRAALIIALNPVAITLSSSLFLQEKLNRHKLAGVGISLVGAAVVISQGNVAKVLAQGISWGDLSIFGCVVSWTTYTLVGRRVMQTLSAPAATTYACALGAILLLPPALAEGLLTRWGSFQLPAWLGVIYLGVFASAIGFTWFYEGVQQIGAAKAGIFINLVPVCAVILGVLVLAEPLTWSIGLGGGLVLAGVVLVSKR